MRGCLQREVFWCSSIIAMLAFLFSAAVAQPLKPPTFHEYLQKRFGVESAHWDPERFCPVSSNVVASRVLTAYGAVFAAADSVVLPDSCIHTGEASVLKYQKRIATKPVEFGSVRVRLQAPAADSLMRSIQLAAEKQKRITPLDGAIAGGRSYGDTLMLWNSRFFPALDYWFRQGRLSQAELDDIRKVDLQSKIEKIIELEKRGICFSTNRTRSIFTSVAPPGTSQHLSLLAFDVIEYWDQDVRGILNENGWFQTVVDDPPHFTYLGVPESDLPQRGLRAVSKGGFMYWIPNLSSEP